MCRVATPVFDVDADHHDNEPKDVSREEAEKILVVADEIVPGPGSPG
jgi:hypothetical protein